MNVPQQWPTSRTGDNIAGDIRAVRSRIVNGALIGLAAIALPALLASLSRIPETGWLPVMGVHAGAAGSVLVVAIARRVLSYGVRTAFLLAILYLLGLSGVLTFGLSGGGGVMFFISVTVLGAVLLPPWIAVGIFAVCVATMGAGYMFAASGRIAERVDLVAYATAPGSWATSILGLVLVCAMLGMSLAVLIRHLGAALNRETRERAVLDQLVASAPEGILLLDETGQIRHANPVIESMFGYAPGALIGVSVSEMLPGFSAAPPTLPARSVQQPGTRRDGGALPVEYRCGRFSQTGRDWTIVVVRDITQTKLVEDKLLQAQKMEVMGQLAGGVAHDFGNLLAVANGNADLLRDHIGDDWRLVNLVRALEQGGELSRRLLSYARRRPLAPRVIDVSEVVPDMGGLIKQAAGSRVEVVTAVEAGLPSIEADPGELENALLNLVLNAREAMPHGGTINVEFARLDPEFAARQMPAGKRLDDGVRITVTDAGNGMAADVRERAFEAFFTTRAGRGSGLGLPMVQHFASRAGGAAFIESTAGKGTSVHLLLPSARSRMSPDSAERSGAATG